MLNRRKFLGWTAGTVALGGGGLYALRPTIKRHVFPRPDTSSPTGTLDASEMVTIIALGEVLAHSQSIPPAEFFTIFVNEMTQARKGAHKEFVSAAHLLDSRSAAMRGNAERVGFAALSRAERDGVLKSLLYQYSRRERLERKFEKYSVSKAALAMRWYVMTPLLQHYYRSPYGWRAIGYERYPGVARDPLSYTQPG